jgi:D-arabinose 1-dehydrogenase-like Zn-dependent alcohol dehydrogenase
LEAFRFHGSKVGARLEEVPRPVRGAETDMLVRVAGAGVCRTDLHILDGHFDSMISHVPFTMGHESVGWVEEPSPALPELETGDPVIIYPQSTCGTCTSCRAGDDMGCVRGKFYGLDGTDGGFAEHLNVSARCVIPIPKGNDPVSFAPLADAGLTAYHSVKKAASALGPMGAAVVIGVGGVGQVAIQLLRLMTPAEIIAIDVAEGKLKLAEELGANHVVLSGGDQERLVKEIGKLTNGNGPDVVLDFVGETSTATLALQVLARRGVYSVVGYGGDVSVPTMSLVAREIRIWGNLVGTYNELGELVKIFVRRELKAQIDRHPLGDIEGVLSALRKGEMKGRAVMMP